MNSNTIKFEIALLIICLFLILSGCNDAPQYQYQDKMSPSVDVTPIPQKPDSLSLLGLLSNKEKYSTEKVTVNGYMFSNSSSSEWFTLTGTPDGLNPNVDVYYGALPIEKKGKLLQLNPGGSTKYEVIVTGIFSSNKTIRATEVYVYYRGYPID